MVSLDKLLRRAAMRSQAGKKKPKLALLPKKPDDEDHVEGKHTVSISELMKDGRQRIDQRLEDIKRGKSVDYALLRIDFYFLVNERQWYSADPIYEEDRLIISFLKRSVGCPKQSICGSMVLYHFWLQYGFLKERSIVDAKGVGVFNDEHNLGEYPEYDDEQEAPEEEKFSLSKYEEGIDRFITESIRIVRTSYR